MDPLSITASAVAIATIAAQVGVAFKKLREVCVELPGRVHALSNEVNDLEVVLYQLGSVVQEQHGLTDNDQAAIGSLIAQARERLEELRKIVERLVAVCTNRPTMFRATVWRSLYPKLQSLQEEIRDIKSSLNVLIGASNS
jgi:archaellum component FlaC